MNVQEGDQVEIEVPTGGFSVVEVKAVADNVVDRTPGILFEEVYGSGSGRATMDQITEVLGDEENDRVFGRPSQRL